MTTLSQKIWIWYGFLWHTVKNIYWTLILFCLNAFTALLTEWYIALKIVLHSSSGVHIFVDAYKFVPKTTTISSISKSLFNLRCRYCAIWRQRLDRSIYKCLSRDASKRNAATHVEVIGTKNQQPLQLWHAQGM